MKGYSYTVESWDLGARDGLYEGESIYRLNIDGINH